MYDIEEMDKQILILETKRAKLNRKADSISYEVNEIRRKKELAKEYNIIKNFRLRPEHIKLLKNMKFEGMWNGDLVSIGACGKRPFGYSNMYRSIAEILSWKLSNDELSDVQKKRADRLLDELPLALNLIIKKIR